MRLFTLPYYKQLKDITELNKYFIFTNLYDFYINMVWAKEGGIGICKLSLVMNMVVNVMCGCNFLEFFKLTVDLISQGSFRLGRKNILYKHFSMSITLMPVLFCFKMRMIIP